MFHIFSLKYSFEEDIESDDENCNTPEERKFIVFESQLLSPFTFCPQSGKIITTKRKNTQGSMLIIKTTCLNGHSNVWQSQPKINEAAIGNLLIPAAILLVATPINILAKGDLHVLGPIE